MVKLNIGCGEKWEIGQGWLNLDLRKLMPPPGVVYLRHDVRHLLDLLKPDSTDFIKAHDILEHLWVKDAKQLLKDCHTLLIKGGKLELKTPEIGLLIKWANTHAEEDTAFRWYGGQEYPENIHKFCWPRKSLLAELAKLGFSVEKTGEMEDTNIILTAVKL